MDEQKRFINFIVASMLILWVWSVFVQPQLFPPPKPAPVKDVKKDGVAADPKGEKKEGPAKEAKPTGKLKEYPKRNDVVIGSDKPESGYRMKVSFDSAGASVSRIELLDPRYFDLDKKPKQPLSVIQADPKTHFDTLDTEVPEVDVQLKKFGKTLKDVDWEVVKGQQTEDSVTWRYVTPDDSLEIRKKYSLEAVPVGQPNQEYKAYGLKFALSFANIGKEAKQLQYEMYGPVGLPIENRYYTQKWRDVAVGFVAPNGALTPKLVASETIRQNLEKQREEEWSTPLKYAGVDIQYFAALVIPQVDQIKTPYFSNSKAVFVDDAPKDVKAETKFRSPTLKFTSTEINLAPKGAPKGESTVSHEFVLFAGPKRADLLAPWGAERVIDYGWFSGRFGIPQLLLGILSTFHRGLSSFMPWPYGWSIILLTVLVRSCLFPLTRKQALAAAKMQELQPEITALKEKYKNAPEKFAKAQMELFSKNKCNPLGGCLPALIQLPIFLGLYHAFGISVEMRGAPFLWIDNLAAPDALFKFPFVMPFLGPSFNLLPILTVCLFLVQQKMLMPPATTPEAEMQQKVMFYMTIFMGYMFYSVAAGLCVYFIASSLWGLAERKLLPKSKLAAGGVLAQTTASSGKNDKIAVDLLPKSGSK